MNQRLPGFPPKAIEGFLQFKTAEALSSSTLASYKHIFRQWIGHVGDVNVTQLNADSVRNYLAWLRTDYKRWRHRTRVTNQFQMQGHLTDK